MANNTAKKEIKKPVEKVNEVVTGVVVNCDILNVRTKPSFKSDIIKTIGLGTKLIVEKANDSWYKISGEDQFVCADFIREE